MSVDNDTIDVRDLTAALRRRVAWIVVGPLIGLLLAVAAIRWLPAEYEGVSAVLVRSSSAGASPLARLSGLADLIPGGMGGVEGDIETELQILTSRTVVGQLVDSLRLQAWVVAPERTGVDDLLSSVVVDGELSRPVEYSFRRTDGGYAVTGPGVAETVAAGEVVRLPTATLVVREGELPEEFAIQVMDREDAITRVKENLTAEQVAGEVAEIVYRAGDPRTAALVPNLLVQEYLLRRRTTDRGVNQHRYEFLAARVDSIASELAIAEGSLRSQQESSGILDPEISGRAELEQAMGLRAELEAVEVEARSLEQILAQSTTGSLSPRQLAAYPTFLRNPAINDLLSRLLEAETDRVELLQRRTEQDSDVIALSESIEHLESQLVTLSRAYLSGLGRQREELQTELGSYQAALAALPRHAEANLRLQRDVLRLSETLIALQTQLVQARLEAIGEGGEVRQIDVAVPPKEVAFPSPILFTTLGVFGGLVLGVFGALGREYAAPRLVEPRQVELALRTPATALLPGAPLFLGGIDAWRTVLVVPAGTGADSSQVAHRIAETAHLQGHVLAVADFVSRPPALPAPAARGVALVRKEPPHSLTGAVGLGDDFPVYRPGEEGGPVHGARAAMEELERDFTLVVAALPELSDPITTSLVRPDRPVVLAVRAGRAARSEVEPILEGLRRMGVTTLAVVLHNGTGNGN